MALQVIDSPRLCPRCSKRMVMELGQDEAENWHLHAIHICWNCDHREDQRLWSRPLRTDGESAARRRLDRLRSGSTGCHGVVESHRSGAVAGGWLVLSREDPARVAVLITRDRWVHLDDLGRYVEAA